MVGTLTTGEAQVHLLETGPDMAILKRFRDGRELDRKVASSRPSSSSMADTEAVSVSPTCAVPEISGRPAGAAFSGSGVSFVTASPAKVAASLPAASWSGAASAPAGTV